ncbi:arylsulfatase K isoform 2-T2 [Discoglossus pictus]
MAVVIPGSAAVLFLLCTLTAALSHKVWESSQNSSNQYNVVMVMSDAFDGRLTFSPDDNLVSLPNLNFMKSNGAVFLNAYTNSPICCPSRAAMWSGLFAHLTESWNNFKCLDHDYPTWMDIVKRHGYITQKFGKEDYRSGSHSLSNRVEAWTRDVPFLLRQEGRPVANVRGKKTQIRVMEEDWKNTDTAANWIRQEAKNLSQPFILYLGLNLPHPYPTESMGENYGSSTFLTSPYWLQRVSYKNITIPQWLPLPSMHPVDYYSSYTKNCTGHFTDSEIRDIRACYYAMCAETDGLLGEIISALNETGLLGKTFLLFTSDHGELAMEHRQFYKMSMYEGSSHVPLFIMGPKIKPMQQISNIVSLVDLYPTMLDLSTDPDELKNVAAQFPDIVLYMEKKLHSILDYPKVSASVHQYNREQFATWKESLGLNYSNVISNLRWHTDWNKRPKAYEMAIDKWLKSSTKK